MLPNPQDRVPRFHKPAPVPARYLYAVMASLGLMACAVTRLNTNMGIVAMVNHTALEATEKPDQEGCCPGHSIPPEEDGPFVWTQDQQARILASYFIGYIITQYPGALCSQYLSAKWMLFSAISGNIGLCLLIPVAARRVGYGCVVVVRIFQGLFAGTIFPCVAVMTSRWSPPNERSIISGIIYAGFSMGVVLTNLFSGLLAKHLGWEWVFYLLGLIFIPWCILWAVFVADNPTKSKFITAGELKFIMDELGDEIDLEDLKRDFPAKDAFRSKPFWALLFALVCNDSAWYLCQTYTPKFMRDVMYRGLEQNAAWSTLPFLLNWIVSIVVGTLVDRGRMEKEITTTTARQLTTTIGAIVPAFCLSGIGFVNCNFAAGIAYITIAIAALGTGWVGLLPNHIDLSPNFGGILMGITNTATCIPGILMPLVVGELTKEKNCLQEWSIAFDIVAVLLFLMCVVYCCLGSGEVQPWNTPKESTEHT